MNTSLVVDGSIVNLRADGRLRDLNNWTPKLATELAKQEGIELTDEHWNVINTMRGYYAEFNLSPILKLLRRELSKKFSAESASVEKLEALFPNGVQRQGSRLAGVPLAHLDAELEQAQRAPPVQSASSGVTRLNDLIEFNGNSIKLYADGSLVNLEDWNEELAAVLAEKEGIQLTDEHWAIVNYLRKFYFKYGIAPMVKILIKHMSEELGKENVNKERMYELFHGVQPGKGLV